MTHGHEIYQLQRILMDSEQLALTASRSLPARPATFAPVPHELHPQVREDLSHRYPGGLYAHQARGILRFIAGSDICLATPTASGKSLIFQTLAAHEVHSNDDSTVLALYPLRALLKDQQSKWEATTVSTARIDGGVPMDERTEVLSRHRVCLATPDVVHAWMLRSLDQPEVREFVRHLRLLILDEVHVYEGVFGSNIAYLLARLRALAPQMRVVSATATIDAPACHVANLTGRTPEVIGPDDDGSPRYRVDVLAFTAEGNIETAIVNLIKRLADKDEGSPSSKFLIFADSRKLVERIVARVRQMEPHDSGTSLVEAYRAGYEDDDRQRIQSALASGALRGIVSTSALEMGVDIGDIDLVVIIGFPPTQKSLLQRIGRAGRQGDAVCAIVGRPSEMPHRNVELYQRLNRTPEANHLYLENRYLQYAHALCAAVEHANYTSGGLAPDQEMLSSLPQSFRDFLRDEIAGDAYVPDDLYPIKQLVANRAPHREFPLRDAVEPTFDIVLRGFDVRMGTISWSQVLREAYPGAIYLHQAKAYRVHRIEMAQKRIHTVRTGFGNTRPDIQSMVFPNLSTGVLASRVAGTCFAVEANLQVSQRVLGFQENSGADIHAYGPGSPWSQRPLLRFFPTTGICIFVRSLNNPNVISALATVCREVFCGVFNLSSRDIGSGRFFVKTDAMGFSGPLQGIAIYDETYGSLRLTQGLLHRVHDFLQQDVLIDGDLQDASLSTLRESLAHLPPPVASETSDTVGAPSSLRTVIRPGSEGLLTSGLEQRVVRIDEVFFRPDGLAYRLHEPALQNWVVAAIKVQAINGRSELAQFDLESGRLVSE